MSCLTHSHFGGFLLHRGWLRPALARKARAVLSTGCNAVSPRQYVHRADDIGMVLVAAIDAFKLRLRLAVCLGDIPAARACLAGVVRWHGHQHPAVPGELVLQLPALVNSLKGVSSRMIRQKNYPSVREKSWGAALWSPSYFAGSCGGAPIAVIRQYIEQQQTPH